MNKTGLKTGLVVSFAAFVISGTLLAVMGYQAWAGRESKAGGSVSVVDAEYQKMPPGANADWLTSFSLTERSGKVVQWDELAGKVRVVSFFFSSCPASCLQQNYKTRDLQQNYAGKNVVFASITCDPDTDTPERLSEYANKLNADPAQWLFLTGRLAYIRRVASELFSVGLDKQTHSERFIVCDKWGKVRGTFVWNKLDEITELKLLVEKLLAEESPPADSQQAAGQTGD
jgi:protein SCO1